MTAATLAAILALLTEAIKDTPAIIADIESMVSNAKKTAAGGDPAPAPIEPGVVADTAQLAMKLGAKP